MLLMAAQVILLGTGTPNADPERSGPAVAVVAGGVPYIVDCGPGVVRRAAAAHIKPADLKIAFVTHLHSDHTTGLADLILAPWTLERADPLELYGPRGIRSMAAHILAAYREDIRVRLNGGEPSNKTGFRVHAHKVRDGVVYRDQNVTVTAFRVPHGEWKDAFGYRFDTSDGRSIVISGDTGPSDAVVKACNGCDVLVHEVYSTSGFLRRPVEWQRYHARYHTSAAELSEIATRARPGVLVLTHQLYWGTPDAELLGEVTKGYGGRVVSGRDLGVY